MKNLYLLNRLLETTKENRLAFMAPEGKKTDTAPAAPKADDKKEAAAPSPEVQTKEKLAERSGKLKTKVEDIVKPENKDKYTEGLKKGAQEIKDALGKIETEMAKLDEKKDIKKDLEKFDKELKKYEKDGDKDLDKKYDTDTLAADEAVKKVQDAVTAQKAEVTVDKVAKALGEKTPPVTLTEAQKKDLTAKIEKAFKDVETSIDPKAKANEEAAALKENADAALVKIGEINVDSFVKDLETEIADAEKQKATAEKAYNVLVEAAKPGKLEFSLEDLQNVIGTYGLGKYESPKDKATTAAIMEALKDNADALKKANIDIGFLGGTDGTDYKEKLITDKDFNEKKNTALQGLLVMNANGGVSPALTPDQITLITDYNTAVTAGMPAVATFLDKAGSNHDKFFKGGGIFDLGLAYQRALDRKIALTGDKKAVLGKKDTLKIDLGSGNDTEEERKSGIVLIDTTPVPENKEEEDKKVEYKIGPKGELVVVTPAPEPTDPKAPKKKPKETTYVLTPGPGTEAEIIIKEGKPKVKVGEEEIDLTIGPDGLPTGGNDGKDISIKVSSPEGVNPGVITIETNKEGPVDPNYPDIAPVDPDHQEDSPEERQERAHCKLQNIKYQTRKEAIDNGDAIQDAEGKVTSRPNTEWLNPISSTTNFSVKEKAAAPVLPDAAPLPGTATPDTEPAPVPPAPADVPADPTPNPAPDTAPVAPPEGPKEFEYKLLDGNKILEVGREGKEYKYTIENPDKANLKVESGKKNPNNKFVEVELNGAKACFEFNPVDGKFIPFAATEEDKDLRNTHELKCEKGVISIKKLSPEAKTKIDIGAKINEIKTKYGVLGIVIDSNVQPPSSVVERLDRIAKALEGLTPEEKTVLPRVGLFMSGSASLDTYDKASNRINVGSGGEQDSPALILKKGIKEFGEYESGEGKERNAIDKRLNTLRTTYNIKNILPGGEYDPKKLAEGVTNVGKAFGLVKQADANAFVGVETLVVYLTDGAWDEGATAKGAVLDFDETPEDIAKDLKDGIADWKKAHPLPAAGPAKKTE